MYGCERSKVWRHLHDKTAHSHAGRPCFLTAKEEKDLVRCCQVLVDFGVCADMDVVGKVVRHYLQASGRPSPFQEGIQGRKWWQNFLQRWPELCERKPVHLTVQRAIAATAENISQFFDKLTHFKTIGLLDLSYADLGQRLWNCDETGICTSVSARRVLVKRGTRVVSEVVCGSGREHITTLFCGSAVGERLPPYVVYKGRQLTMAGRLYSVSSSGWMETPHFQEWFEKLFLPAVEYLTKKGPVVVFLDGHNSHTALQLIGRAKAKKTTIYCLPLHTTHLLQPLDLAVFGPLKSVWRKSVREHKLATNATQISKHIFP